MSYAKSMVTITKLLAQTASSGSDLTLYKSGQNWYATVSNPTSRGRLHFEATGSGDTPARAIDRAAEAVRIMNREGDQTVVVKGSGVYRS